VASRERNFLAWASKDGYFDPGQLPIDGVLKQATSDDENEFRSGLNMLQSMHVHGRKEAGVFLLGLLVACDDTWEKRTAIVEALKLVETKGCVELLFSELRRVKSSNTTRRYLTTIVNVLEHMPYELVSDGFADLASDLSFSPKMRAKFEAALENCVYHGTDSF